MWKAPINCLFLLFLLTFVNGDIYLHSPRGSNNRLNENSKTRKNNNRLFDSQNNNNGGYNVGDATSQAAGTNANKQYQMKYFQSGKNSSSFLTIEWTNQHGCGGCPRKLQKVNCNLVLQFMCQPNDGSVPEIDKIRAGINTDKQPFTYQPLQFTSISAQGNRKNKNVKNNFGLHENWEWYDRCYHRENNKGLFTADQKLRKINRYSRAIHTRQNKNGQRSGYECPEERDYYPYWHPTPWVDIAVLSESIAMCQNYKKKSFNAGPYEECVEKTGNKKEWIRRSRWNNKVECEAANGKWLAFHNFLERAPQFTNERSCLNAAKQTKIPYIWGLPSDTKNIDKYECLVGVDPIVCKKAPYSRVNHLGNGVSKKANTFTWTLPHFPSGKEQRCVFRIRYNITTDDYNPYKTDASDNRRVIRNDPTINFEGVPLQLAINTAQFGRVFQDRSHVFILKPRPAELDNNRIYNLNVRGKRGNIVQVYPAVEYDFAPNTLKIEANDLLHIQWTGSNTNPRNNDGEGTAGTDRSNLLQMKKLDLSYPLPFENTNIWNNSEIVWIHHGVKTVSSADLAIDMASSGYYSCVSTSSCPASLVQNSLEKKAKMNNLLNNAPASYEGALLRIKRGNYYYMCTRNNNFSNRSQKGTLIVV